MENQYRLKILEALKGVVKTVPKVKHVTIDASIGQSYAGGILPAVEIHWISEDISYRITSHSRRSATVKLVIHASSQVDIVDILDSLDIALESNYTLDHTCILCKPVSNRRELNSNEKRTSIEHYLEITYGRRTK